MQKQAVLDHQKISNNNSDSQFKKPKEEKKTEQGSRRRFAWHPLPGPTEVQVCRRHWSRIFVFSPPLGGGIQVYHPARDGTGLLCRSSPPSVGLHWAFSPVWWISCLILLSWMIWGIIPKVRYSSFCLCIVILSLYCELLMSLLCDTLRVVLNFMNSCSIHFDSFLPNNIESCN